ncbi:MAG: homocysteine S-methyltransferase family protein [Pseudomonadota bacterium]
MALVTLLDGGMGQELVRRSKYKPHPLWSANILMHEAWLVKELHQAYIEAGARVITLNSYSITPERLQAHELEHEFVPLQNRAIQIAREARDQSEHSVSIAGCLPPLVASYRPDKAPDFERCLQTYRRIVEVQAPHVDVFLCETLSSIKEAKAAAKAINESGKACWLSFSLSDDIAHVLRSNEPLEKAIKNLLESADLKAILLNCSSPETIDQSISMVVEQAKPIGVRTGAYANGFISIKDLKPGGTVENLDARKDLTPHEYTKFALNWLKKGAHILGGCCEITPQHIQHLSQTLLKKGHQINHL